MLKVVLLCVFLPSISSECKKTYITICENLSDLTLQEITSITELMITPNFNNENSLAKFDLFELNKLKKLKILIIVEKINQLINSYLEITLSGGFDFISFYGNEMKQIHTTHFPIFSTKTLNLVNNKIEFIEKGTFMKHSIEVLDLSENFLTAIERNVLPTNDKTKMIIVKKNFLELLEVGCFPGSLKVLELDYNHLKYLEYNIFDNLKNLELLSLSHNKLSVLPNMGAMGDLQSVNLSFNFITSLEQDTFLSQTKLKILDLSHNKIINPNIINNLFIEGQQNFLKVNLAFNRLQTLNIRSSMFLNERTFILYGNPWDCAHLKNKYTSKVLICYVTKCDLEFYSSGITPFCVNYEWEKLNFSMREREIDKFQKTIREKKHLIGCDLMGNLENRRRAKPNFPICDDSAELDFRLSLLETRFDNILD